MGYDIAHKGSDFRLIDCKHERLRQALEFRPAGGRVVLDAEPAPSLMPAVERDLEISLEMERTTPIGFLAGAASTLVVALIWFMLACTTTTNIDAADYQNDSTTRQVLTQTNRS